MTREASLRKLRIVFRGVIIFIGLTGLIIIGRDYLRGQASLTWPVVSGQIIHSSVEEPDSYRGGRRYAPKISYEYSINGRKYSGENISFGEMIWMRKKTDALQFAANYFVGRNVKVYFNPSRHQMACLIPGATPIIEIIVGVFMCLLILSVGLFFIKPGCFRETP